MALLLVGLSEDFGQHGNAIQPLAFEDNLRRI